jgi:hypothetical protein
MTELTGEFRVDMAGVNEGDAGALVRLLETFFAALELGMFPPASVGSREGPALADGTMRLSFQGARVPDAAFRVLAGMLTYFDAIVGPLGAHEATVHSVRGNLLHGTVPFPAWPQPLPFDTDFDIPGGTAPPLLVLADFRRAVSEAEREGFLRQVEVWHALLQGGYPRDDDLEGESGSGPVSIRFNSPSTLLVDSENWRADERCFTPLFNLLIHWGREGAPVDLVTIE